MTSQCKCNLCVWAYSQAERDKFQDGKVYILKWAEATDTEFDTYAKEVMEKFESLDQERIKLP